MSNESDVAPLNIGLTTAYHRAQNQQTGGRSWKRQRPLDKPHDDNDDDFNVSEPNRRFDLITQTDTNAVSRIRHG